MAEALADRRLSPTSWSVSGIPTPAGVFYSRSDDGRSCLLLCRQYAGRRQDRDKALRLSQVDPLMRSIRRPIRWWRRSFNSWDSYNRIYPISTCCSSTRTTWISRSTTSITRPMPHNPNLARDEVWTEVYLDPARPGLDDVGHCAGVPRRFPRGWSAWT